MDMDEIRRQDLLRCDSIRSDALYKAIDLVGHSLNPATTKTIITMATKFEKYLRGDAQ